MASKKDQSKSVAISDKDKNYQDALMDIEKQYGKGSVMLLGSKGAISCPSISTGALSLDVALGVGGVPRGRIVEIYGPESSGKTTLCSHIIANAQRLGEKCAFIDTEHALDPSYAKKIGVDVDKLVISQPDCAEDALGIAEILVRSNSFAVIVIDSVAALVPRAEIEGQMGDSHVGLHARLMSQALRKLTGVVSSSKTCLIFTNQIRMKIGVMFGNPETTTGGNALKFYSSIRMDIRKGEAIKESNGEVSGYKTKVKVVKNKLAPPFRVAEFDINFSPGGIDSYGCVLDMAIASNVIEKRGSWFSFESNQIGQGREMTISTIKSDPKLYETIEKSLYEKLKIKASVEESQKIEASAEEFEEMSFDVVGDSEETDQGMS